MKQSFFIYLSLIFLLLACVQKEKIDLPLDDERMVDFIVDMHYLEGIVQKSHKDDRDSVRKAIENQIVHIYNLDSNDNLDSILSKAQNYPVYFKNIQDKASILLDSLEKHVEKDFMNHIEK